MLFDDQGQPLALRDFFKHRESMLRDHFTQVFILTQGGPGFATEMVSLYIYRTAFRFFNFGYAAAMSFVVLALTTIFARALLRVMRVGSAR